MDEYAFELALCAELETSSDGIIARQLGTGVHAPGNRVMDIVLVEPGPAFAHRIGITPEAIPEPAIAAAVGPGRARHWKRAFDTLDMHPEAVRRIIDRAIDVGFFEGERRNGRQYIRQTTRYPDWFSGLTGIENKPDLGSPGDLEIQLRTDVSLGVLDRVVLATTSYVTGAHLNRIPDSVGVWRYQPGGDIEIIRPAQGVATDDYGIEILDTHTGRTDIAIITPAQKERCRRRVAERAYAKGWQPARYPPCARLDPTWGGVPQCTFYEKIVHHRKCGPDCPGFTAGEPADRRSLREANSPWCGSVVGTARRQAGLDAFTSE